MSERIHALAQQIFGKPSIEECSLQELEELADRYPYFAPAQFLLLQKYRQEQSPGYEQQLRKSVLYYHNPVEFEYFISSDKFYTEIPSPKETVVDDVAVEAPLPDHPVIEPGQPAEVPLTTTVEEPAEVLSNATADEQAEVPVDAIENVSTVEEPVQSADVGELSFEPYHTVDYFASQGIKPVLDEAPQDKFGKQLKSFTQWLKTMKRLPAAEAGKQIDVSAENKVLDLANDSVHATEVATEAMAEVWLKQGNLEKARAIFEKLGLKEKYRDFDAFVAAKR